MQLKKRHQGFTLLEISISLCIISLSFATIIINFLKLDKKLNEYEQEIIQSRVELY
jgi:prepilin-type N-terminal cleavage/methylation domain-containing protein